MKRFTYTIIALLSFTFFGHQSVYAQFEGIINFVKVKAETTKYTYYIKGNRIRIDEFGSDGTVKGIMLIDTDKKNVTALSPGRNLYMDATNNKVPAKANPKLKKTSNTKTINEMECTEWTATSEVEATVISYWVINEDKYSFFEPLLKTLNRKDRLSRYWTELPGITNKFTMIGEEKSLEGVTRTKLEVTSMEAKTIDASLFDIPKDYVRFEK